MGWTAFSAPRQRSARVFDAGRGEAGPQRPAGEAAVRSGPGLLPGRRASIEPMAEQRGGVAQGLQQVVSDSPWSDPAAWTVVRQEIVPQLEPTEARVIDAPVVRGVAATRVAPVGGEREKLWLVVDWPADAAEPYHGDLARPQRAATQVRCLTLSGSRWQIEQYLQRAKDDLGFDHFEGRSWTGFLHPHPVLSALAYLFILTGHARAKKFRCAVGAGPSGRSSRRGRGRPALAAAAAANLKISSSA